MKCKTKEDLFRACLVLFGPPEPDDNTISEAYSHWYIRECDPNRDKPADPYDLLWDYSDYTCMFKVDGQPEFNLEEVFIKEYKAWLKKKSTS